MSSAKYRALLICQYVFATAGVVGLCDWAWKTLGAKRFQAAESRKFSKNVNAPRPQPDASVGRREARVEGSTVAKLTIPDLGVALIVVEGVSARDLNLGPGHIPGTSFPGEPGNIGIAGHRDTVFRPLRFVREGQIITLTTLQREDRYRVASTKVVLPTDTQVLKPTGGDDLTLVTCYPFGFAGPAPKRFIVHAERVP
jgi:sortase A